MSQHRGLGSWLPTRALKSPEAVALVADDAERIDYRSLADRAARVAGMLAARGVGRGDRVAFLGDNQPALVEVLFGAVELGAVFVPLNTRLAAPELEYIVGHAGARLLIHDDRLTELAAAAAPALPRIAVGGERGDFERERDAATPVAAPVDVSPHEPAAILYTSGTTGRPKGAVLSHDNLTWNAVNVLVDVDLVSTDVALVISPLFHAASLGMGLLPVLLKGATAVLERSFDPGRALRLIQEHRITMLSGVPTTYQFMAEHPDWAATDISSLRKLTCGGSPVPTRVLEAYEARGLSFSQGYGMTETSPGATYLPATMTRAKMGSAGVAHFFTDVRVATPEGEVLPAGEVGEIQVRGPNVTPGYHEDAGATAAAFTADGWFRTGDLGTFDADGYLFVSDRLKDMIISGGENIYPAEVEDLVLGIPHVTAAALIGVADDRWGEVPWLVASIRPGTELTIDEVRAHLDGRVARYKLPKRLVLLDELPRTASGKVRKVDLRARLAADAAGASA